MDEPRAEGLVNRDEPTPVIPPLSDNHDSPLAGESKRPASRRQALKEALHATKLKEKLEGLAGPTVESPGKLQDRLLTMLLQQVIPTEGGSEAGGTKDRRSQEYVERPNFSLPAMSSNFRRFNARCGVLFVFQNRMIRLFSWRAPTQTLSFLAVYTFICLDPTLLPAVPLALCLFYIMIPAFLARHPPPPNDSPIDQHPLQGPPLAPPRIVKPAADLSKDFFRNMRDLQNSMEDFSTLHDMLVELVAPLTNFSNEALSSTLFLAISAVTCLLFISAHLVPWRAIFLIGGWAATCSGHPAVQAMLHTEHTETVIREHETEARSLFDSFVASDVILSSAPEKREVEIFELQRRDVSAPDREYEPFLFSPSPYTPLSPSRIAGDRPRGTRFFEDVQAPRGWRWSDKKWSLDLLSREWVEERCFTGVEVEVEGERWVSDILYDEDAPGQPSQKPVGVEKAGEQQKGKQKIISWEEANNLGKKGEWRRRRWVRLVERKPIATNVEA